MALVKVTKHRNVVVTNLNEKQRMIKKKKKKKTLSNRIPCMGVWCFSAFKLEKTVTTVHTFISAGHTDVRNKKHVYSVHSCTD